MTAYQYPPAASPYPTAPVTDPTAVMGRRTLAFIVDVLLFTLVASFFGPTPLSPFALYEEVRERQRARLGPTHPETLRLGNNLAEAYRARGELPKAMPLFEEVLTGTRARLGPTHPRTLTAMARRR